MSYSTPPIKGEIPRGLWMFILALIPTLFGFFAISLGQDANWDLKNYHFYNPYAFLTGRLDFDILPGQVATFYNPLLYLPFYYAVTSLPPKMVGFLLGTIQGINFILLYFISKDLLPANLIAVQRRRHSFLIALVGMLAAGNISELGTMFADNILSLFILSALLLVVRNHPYLCAPLSSRAIAVALGSGLLCGLAAGLKQPAAIFCVGMCLAFLFIAGRMKDRLLLAFFFGLGVLAGIALFAGFWMYDLWARFGNPLFPYFNHIFKSPMATLGDYRDARFLPRNITDALIFPFFFAFAPRKTAEIAFCDLRLPLWYALLLLSVLVLPFLRFLKNTTHHPQIEPSFVRLDRSKARFIQITMLASYGAWLKIFAIYRYIVPLEFLAPLGIWLLLDRLVARPLLRNILVLASFLVILITLKPATWGRVPWNGDYFGVTPPPIADPAHTMVIMTGIEPTAYLIPFFPPEVRFVRIQSYFTAPSDTPNGYDRLMERLIREHNGPFAVIYRAQYEEESTQKALSAYGLTTDQDRCENFTPRIESGFAQPLRWCPVIREGGSESDRTYPATTESP